MAKKMSISQFKSKIRQAENKYKQQIRQVNNAINNYNRKVRQHNSKVLQNRSRINSELRKLSSVQTKTTYSSSVTKLHLSYQKVAENYDTNDVSSNFKEYLYSEIEQENANNLTTANVVLENTNSLSDIYSLQDTQIMEQLATISKDLDNRWKGAIFSLNPHNPDATRHFCTSAREIFTEIFNTKATDKEVFATIPDCEKTDNGNATRRSKIAYFLHKKAIKDEAIENFIDDDITNILELFHILSDGTHGKAGKYNNNQLSVIKKRVEDGLIFLCNIVL